MRSFGYFSPNDNKIWVYCANRNMADILRTLAHELVHRKQDEDGRINYESGKTGSEIENEANAMAGVLLRDFGKQHEEIYQ
jgi:Zn-dependent peptidase ImmA (M78 family)